jgi:hypothetical protein
MRQRYVKPLAAASPDNVTKRPANSNRRSEGQERFVLERHSPDLLISCLYALTVEPGFASLQYVVSGFSRTFTTVRLKADTTYFALKLSDSWKVPSMAGLKPCATDSAEALRHRYSLSWFCKS